MMTVDEFSNLAKGDMIEGPSLFPRISVEPVVLLTTLKTNRRAEFVVSWMGVTIGRWVCSNKGGNLEWQTPTA